MGHKHKPEWIWSAECALLKWDSFLATCAEVLLSEHKYCYVVNACNLDPSTFTNTHRHGL